MVEGKFLSQIFLQWPTHTSEKFTTAWLAIIYLDYEGASEGLFSGLENSPKQICALEISNLMTLNSFVRFVICSKEHYLVFYSLWQSLSTLATCLSWLNIHSALPCDLVLHLQQHLIPLPTKYINKDGLLYGVLATRISGDFVIVASSRMGLWTLNISCRMSSSPSVHGWGTSLRTSRYRSINGY